MSAPDSVPEQDRYPRRPTLLALLLPYPLLTLALTLVWLLLVGSFHPGHILLGLFLGGFIAWLTSSFWPDRPSIRAYGKLVAYMALVLWDIVVANMQVAWIILFRPVASLESGWIVIPLDIRSPEAITLFAGTITMTPGTVSCDLSADQRHLLVHCLDVMDAPLMVDSIKARYERRLQEIFP